MAAPGYLTVGQIDQISQLLGELKANQERFLDELSTVRNKVESLEKWKWKATGVLMALVTGFEIVKWLLKT